MVECSHPPSVTTESPVNTTRYSCIAYSEFTGSYTGIHRMKEGKVLFNDALNTFYLRLYGVRHMVKDISNSEKGNPLPPHGLLLPISSKGSIIRQTGSYIQRPLLHQLWSTGWNEK